MSVDLVSYGHGPRVQRRLICFACAGGGPLEFLAWPEHFDGTTELVSVRLPGRDSRAGEPAFSRLEPLVTAVQAVLGELPELPTSIFGHSMGALLGFEVCRRLEAMGRPPVTLFVAARLAPQWSELASHVYALPDDAFMTRIAEYQGAPPSAFSHPSLVRLFLPMLRADFEVVETYEYKQSQRLSCPIVAFGGTDDKFTPAAALAAWKQQTSSTFRLRMFPGGHFFFRSSPGDMLKDVEEVLRDTQPESASVTAHGLAREQT